MSSQRQRSVSFNVDYLSYLCTFPSTISRSDLQTVISFRSLECVGCSLSGTRWCLHLSSTLQLSYCSFRSTWQRSVDRWRLSTGIVMVLQISRSLHGLTRTIACLINATEFDMHCPMVDTQEN